MNDPLGAAKASEEPKGPGGRHFHLRYGFSNLGAGDYCPARFSHDLTTAEMRDDIDYALAAKASGGVA